MKTNHHLQYGSLANIYGAFLTLSGFKRGVESFLDRIDFNFSPGAKIFDGGCGTGLFALYFARRFPESDIYASDIEPRMLRELEDVIVKDGISNISVFRNDLNFPEELFDFRSGRKISIQQNFFDSILLSGALEHVDAEKTIQRLSLILKPGGSFLNLGVKQSPAGAVLGMVYKFKPHSLAELSEICRGAGFEDIHSLPLEPKDFPANLSRVAILARKKI
ncbi:hypothetical protein A3I28_00815 [Candidatus Giovannonibacteria bacterium RIFCSPLOWO2_02_FULL_43_37]|nr:MAG: hypothetical protein A3I28_00815 [Candidatus Giovannonibacteria bacterium RIFCSPLOWO2_02_FULL_43_37]